MYSINDLSDMSNVFWLRSMTYLRELEYSAFNKHISWRAMTNVRLTGQKYNVFVLVVFGLYRNVLKNAFANHHKRSEPLVFIFI